MATLKLTKKYDRYSKYKDSGVVWFSKLPEDWVVGPVRSVLNERKDKNTNLVTDNILSVMKDVGVIRYADKGDVGNKSSDRPENYKIVHPGDIVLNSMNLVIGSVGQSKELGVTSSVYIIYYPKNQQVSAEYYHYLFRDKSWQRTLGRLGRGIMELRESIKVQDLKIEPVPIPPIETQRRIAAYLDKKTALIDVIIEKKKKQIELLREKRAAIINRAVTKGLDPNAKLVDSGIEWIGKIPEVWSTDKLAHLMARNDGGAWGDDDPQEQGVKVLRSTDVNQDGSWNLADVITRKLTDTEFKKARLYAGDLLITKSSGSAEHLGKAAIVTENIENGQYAFSNFMQRIRPRNSISPKYLFYVLNNRLVRMQINYWGLTTSGLVNLNAKLISNFIIPIPKREDQEQIANYLDNVVQKSEAIAASVEKSITLLQEFKSALISHVVTGKIKV